MYRLLAIDPATPPAVQLFVRHVADVYLADVHAMLRLPLPQAQITEACNFAILAVLVNVISGASVTLYEPPPNAGESGRKFRETLSGYYPWDEEPAGSVTDAVEGARIVYDLFRNPMAHALGFLDPEPTGPLFVTRFEPLTEAELESVELATTRPNIALHNAPTLTRNATTQALSLNAEAFYWGVRESIRRLTADATRVASAERLLSPMVRRGLPRVAR